MTKTFYIKHYGTEEYLTSSFDPISLPTFGPKMDGHIFEIAHPENDSKTSIFKLVCVPRMVVIPEVVLDATREQDKLTYFGYNDKLQNEEFQIIRYEDGFLIIRDEECLTYNREKEYFYTMKCVPRHPEQLFEIVEAVCSIYPDRVPLETFLQQPPMNIVPIIKPE